MSKFTPITWAVIGGVAFAIALVVLVIVGAMSSLEYSCEVCMTFRGRTECREAAGRTAEEAQRTATDNACSLLGARGMTMSIECTNTPPTSASCRRQGE